MWPQAPIYTAVFSEEGTEGRFAGVKCMRRSFGFETVRPDLSCPPAPVPGGDRVVRSLSYDLVVSSSSAWAHGVLCDPGTVHVSYCHNPFRYAWNQRDQTLARRRNPITRAFLRGAFERWREWDWATAQHTDRYVANSLATRERIRSYFGREANVVYPPVETGRFSPGPVEDYYALVSELMPHKQIEIAVEAFNRLCLPLVVVGDGPRTAR